MKYVNIKYQEGESMQDFINEINNIITREVNEDKKWRPRYSYKSQ